jgi:prevent-host-death family protein
MWTVQEAKSKLSEILKRARAGEPQIIGSREQFVVLSQADYLALRNGEGAPHLGRWLVENAPHGFELDLPSRADDRADPFAWLDEPPPGAGISGRVDRARKAKVGRKGRA